MSAPIPVICDRCRAEGLAGQGGFEAVADILDFDPVPRRARADGWSPEHQRAFIAALAITGAPPRAARAIGKHAFGAEQLRKARGGRSFAAAWDAALEIYRDRETARIRDNMAELAREQEQRELPRDPGAEAVAAEEEREALAALEAVFGYYVMRLGMERQARLEGRIVEADFYVRQITVFEICMDLLTRGEKGEGEAVAERLRDLRIDGHHLNNIGETTMSRLLDDTRRAEWARLGEAERPGPLRHDRLIDTGRGYKLMKDDSLPGGPDHKERSHAQKEEFAAAAKEQIEWEAEARRDYERRREAEARRDDEPRGDSAAGSSA